MNFKSSAELPWRGSYTHLLLARHILYCDRGNFTFVISCWKHTYTLSMWPNRALQWQYLLSASTSGKGNNEVPLPNQDVPGILTGKKIRTLPAFRKGISFVFIMQDGEQKSAMFCWWGHKNDLWYWKWGILLWQSKCQQLSTSLVLNRIL